MLSNSTAMTETLNQSVNSSTSWSHPSSNMIYPSHSLNYEGKTKGIFFKKIFQRFA
jgi:hypothetical protein